MTAPAQIPHVHVDIREAHSRTEDFIAAGPEEQTRALSELRYRAAVNESAAFMPAVLLIAPVLGTAVTLFAAVQALWAEEITRAAQILIAQPAASDAAHGYALDLVFNSQQASQTTWIVLFVALALVALVIGALFIGAGRDRKRAVAVVWLRAYESALLLEADHVHRGGHPRKWAIWQKPSKRPS